MNRVRPLLAVILGLVALALLAPLSANAQVTVFHVKVKISGAGSTTVYCDVLSACTDGSTDGNIEVWNIPPSGITLASGQTLVLTQTAGFSGIINGIAPNFDTSDRIKDPNQTATPVLFSCEPAVPHNGDPCTVTIQLDTGSGLTTVYTDTVGDVLDNFNVDTGAFNHQEQSTQFYTDGWSPAVFSAANFTLKLAYADNVHGCTSNCLPNPFANATVFKGAGTSSAAFCTTGPCYDSGALLITGLNVVTNPNGRMTGGGSVFTPTGMRVTHGLELHCDTSKHPNNLEINWGGGNNFHLTSLISVSCIDDPSIDPGHPAAGFDTYIATGVGTCNGLPAFISFILTDAGEPGRNDTATFDISGGCSLAVSGKLDGGNQQAHKN